MEPGGLAAALILDDPTWHRGVIGILASRVVDRTGRPALVLSHEDGQAYGSGRSVSGFHLLDALTAAHTQHDEPLLSRFGGHAHAVGFSLPSDRVADLRQRMITEAERAFSEVRTAADFECQGELRLSEITPEFLSCLTRLGPFGNGNLEPLFPLQIVAAHLAAEGRPGKASAPQREAGRRAVRRHGLEPPHRLGSAG